MAQLNGLPDRSAYGTTYKTVVFDLDGTLYHQTKLRLTMAMRLGCYYLVHPHRIKELLILKKFREVREHWDELLEENSGLHNIPARNCTEVGDSNDGLHNANSAQNDLDHLQYAYTAEKCKTDAATVERVVLQWIYENPLSALPKCADEKMLQLIRDLRSRNIPVVILSDYPIADKLKALHTEADRFYSVEEDTRLTELKPSPQGLKLILEDYHLRESEILMIGDRDVKDGAAARAAGVDYVIV